VFGIAQLKTDSQYRSNKFRFGQETIMRINDPCFNYVTPLATSINNPSLVCLLERIRQQINRTDEFVLKAIRDMCSLMIRDEQIAQFLYNVPPPNWMYARYVDWFGPYLEEIREENEKGGFSQSNTSTYIVNRIAQTKATLAKFERWKQEVKTPMHQLEMEKITEKATSAGFADTAVGKNWLFNNRDTINHWPPQYIVGKQSCDQK
jgi:hypothetical protein